MNEHALKELMKVVKAGTQASEDNAVDAVERTTNDSFVGFHLGEKTKRQIAALADADGVTLSSYLRDIVKLEILRAARGEQSLRQMYRLEQRRFVASQITDVSAHLNDKE